MAAKKKKVGRKKPPAKKKPTQKSSSSHLETAATNTIAEAKAGDCRQAFQSYTLATLTAGELSVRRLGYTPAGKRAYGLLQEASRIFPKYCLKK